MAAIGASGISLALGLYNTSQISSLKSEVDKLINSPSTSSTSSAPISAEDEIILPELTDLVPTETAVAVTETSFTTSNSTEITELQTSLGDLTAAYNTTSFTITGNRDNVQIVSDDLGVLEKFVGDEMVLVRNRIGTNETNIGANLSSIELLQGDIVTINKASADTNDRIDTSNINISNLDGRVGTLETRATTNEGDITTVSNDLTLLSTAVDTIGDNLDLESDLLDETKLSLENHRADWLNFQDTAYVASGVLNAVSLKADECRLGLYRNDPRNSSIRFDGATSNLWNMYLSEIGVGKNPVNDKISIGHGDVNGESLRMTIGTVSNDGLIFESNSGNALGSISAGGKFRLYDSVMTTLSSSIVGFGHADSGTDLGFKQSKDGTTYLSSTNDKSVDIWANGVRIAYFEESVPLTILNSGYNNTHFGYDGNNYMRAASGKGTYFSTGTAGATVYIKDKEIAINGTNVLDKLTKLEARIATLESKKNIVHGSVVYLRNNNNSKYVRKASASTDVVVDASSADSDNSKSSAGFQILN